MQVFVVFLCALLGCALLGGVFSEQCEVVERVHLRPKGLMVSSALEQDLDLDLDSCQSRCCALQSCDTLVLDEERHLCSLFRCQGQCRFEEDEEEQIRVFTRRDPPRDPPLHIQALDLDPSMRTEDMRTEEQNNSSDVCALPRVVGVCKAAFPRFYFNTASKDCERFIYGGCGANGNNFESLTECQQRCKGASKGSNDAEKASERKSARMAAPQTEMTEDDFKELCVAPPVVGPCRAAFPRWFYNNTDGRCSKFIYGGCKGNKNNHESEEQCTSTCAGVKLLPSKKKQAPVKSEDYEAHCGAAPDSGPCRAAFSMFYFDSETQSCKTFLYGGCRGNDNRYNSEEECVERCANTGASTEGRGQERKRWTAAFFLLLTLAAVSFLLLTALIFITMRRNRTPRRALSIRSDKEELLPDSERSSVDSLPLPESPDNNKA